MGKGVDYLTAVEVAEVAGYTDKNGNPNAKAITSMLASSRRLPEGRAWYVPPPDEYVGRTPRWLRETVDTWLATRLGQGTRSDLMTGS